MITDREKKELMWKTAKQNNAEIQDPLESLRAECLSRGANGIIGFGR